MEDREDEESSSWARRLDKSECRKDVGRKLQKEEGRGVVLVARHQGNSECRKGPGKKLRRKIDEKTKAEEHAAIVNNRAVARLEIHLQSDVVPGGGERKRGESGPTAKHLYHGSSPPVTLVECSRGPLTPE